MRWVSSRGKDDCLPGSCLSDGMRGSTKGAVEDAARGLGMLDTFGFSYHLQIVTPFGILPDCASPVLFPVGIRSGDINVFQTELIMLNHREICHSASQCLADSCSTAI